jgi:putative transposase
MDFVHDQLATGRKIRVLTFVDTFWRSSPAVDPRFSYRGEDVVATLERACRSVGYLKTIRVDQGSEFISRDLDMWAYQRGVELDFSRPGKPTDNAFIESFNGKFRSECLNAHWFLTLDDARLKMEEWRKDYNTVRPHSAIGNKPPEPTPRKFRPGAIQRRGAPQSHIAPKTAGWSKYGLQCSRWARLGPTPHSRVGRHGFDATDLVAASRKSYRPSENSQWDSSV